MTTYVAVVGSRDFTDYGAMEEILDRLLKKKGITKPIIIVSGGAQGADALAERYAEARGLRSDIYPADWTRFKKAAGPIRNRVMAEAADLVVAFWDGSSRGTANMIEEAGKLHKPVVIYNYTTASLERRP